MTCPKVLVFNHFKNVALDVNEIGLDMIVAVDLAEPEAVVQISRMIPSIDIVGFVLLLEIVNDLSSAALSLLRPVDATAELDCFWLWGQKRSLSDARAWLLGFHIWVGFEL